jgi:hypothetical protein
LDIYTCGLENSAKIVHKEMIFHGSVLIGVVPDLQQWQNLVKLIINLVIQYKTGNTSIR